MKKLVGILLALTSITASATTYSPNLLIGLTINGGFGAMDRSPVKGEIYTDGTLVVTLGNGAVLKKTVSGRTLAIAGGMAQQLGAAEITKYRTQVVCKTLVAVPSVVLYSHPYSYQTHQFGPQLKMISNFAGCSSYDHVFPKNELDRSSADSARTLIEILQSELAHDQGLSQ